MKGAPEPHHVLLQKGLLHQWKPGWLVSKIFIAFWCHQTWYNMASWESWEHQRNKGVIFHDFSIFFMTTWDDLNYIFVSFFGLNQSLNNGREHPEDAPEFAVETRLFEKTHIYIYILYYIYIYYVYILYIYTMKIKLLMCVCRTSPHLF